MDLKNREYLQPLFIYTKTLCLLGYAAPVRTSLVTFHCVRHDVSLGQSMHNRGTI